MIKHGTVFTFLGGPDDGATIEGRVELRFERPSEWWNVEHDGYRLAAVVWHGHDSSACAAAYVWREVWER